MIRTLNDKVFIWVLNASNSVGGTTNSYRVKLHLREMTELQKKCHLFLGPKLLEYEG